MVNMPQPLVTIFGKTVRSVVRLRGGGSALPGLFVEKISPNFVPKTLSQLPHGVVVVSGTNGKTTTTKMVVSLLEGQGMRVFTNRTGSNFVRGVAAALLGDMSVTGKLNADIAVLELDEAHAVQFVKVVKPRYSLLLNVMRDQLDRFGEIDATARLLQQVADGTSEKVVLNREDNRILNIGKNLPENKAVYFGLKPELNSYFPNDDELHSESSAKTNLPNSEVMLTSFSENSVHFNIANQDMSTTMKVKGIHNLFNAAAALALVKTVTPQADNQSLLNTLSNVEPAFGRGESLTINGQPLELALVKNPSGFRISLASTENDQYQTMIAINDNYADGRDMSWLWDVSFQRLEKVAAVSGVRAYDMATRLQYDEVPVDFVEPNLAVALKHFIYKNPDQPKRIYCTYTAMLSLRKELSKITKVEEVL